MSGQKRRCACGLTALQIIALAISGCGSKDAAQVPTPRALVGKVLERRVVAWDKYPARLESPQFATVSARVGGIVERAPFAEGALVTKGDVLFVIDDRPFAAEFKSKEADVARAVALASQAEARFKRYESLKGSRAISAEDYDEALAAFSQAKANVSVAIAARDVAKLNLEWTKVIAPISGRVSKKYVTEGNLVTGGTAQATQLTSIASLDPLYVSASVPERSFLKYRDLLRTTPSPATDIPCSVRLENERDFNRQGVLNFFDNRVAPDTGTVDIRCTLPNGDGQLLPGLFVEIRIPGSAAYSTLLVPDTSIGNDQSSQFVLTVAEDTTIARKSVSLGERFGSFREVKSGITKDDRVVLTGLQQLRPGVKVSVEEGPVVEDSIQPFLADSMPGSKAQIAP